MPRFDSHGQGDSVLLLILKILLANLARDMERNKFVEALINGDV
jgi:hypothetical protein